MPTITITQSALDHLNSEKLKLKKTKDRPVAHSETIKNMKIK